MTKAKKKAERNENCTPSRQRETKEGLTEIESNDKMTTKNFTEKPAGISGALAIVIVKKAQTSMSKPENVVNYSFNKQLGHNLKALYTKPPVKIDEVSRSWFHKYLRLL